MSGCFILLLVLALPVFDVWLLLAIGERIGGWTTCALVLAAAFTGLAIARRQRLSSLTSIPAQLAAGRLPAAALADAPMLLLAGVLFVLPGFVTDAIGLLLLLPPVRRVLFALVVRRMLVAAREGRVQVKVFGASMSGPQQEPSPGAAADAPYQPAQDIKVLPADSYSVREHRDDESPAQHGGK